MSSEVASVLLFSTLLLVQVIVPIGLVIVMARQNLRYRASGGREVGAWVATAVYLALLSLPAAILMSVTIHPQPEGLGYLLFLGTLVIFALPGSAIPALITWSLSSWLGATVHPAVVASFTEWLVAGAMAWALFNAVGLRWLTQTGRRRWMRQATGRTKVAVPAGRP